MSETKVIDSTRNPADDGGVRADVDGDGVDEAAVEVRDTDGDLIGWDDTPVLPQAASTSAQITAAPAARAALWAGRGTASLLIIDLRRSGVLVAAHL